MIDDPIPGLKEQLKQAILAETGRMNQLAAAQMLGAELAIGSSRTDHGSQHQMSLHLLLPGSMPLMLTGLRLSSNVAFHATIGVAMVAKPGGLP